MKHYFETADGAIFSPKEQFISKRNGPVET